MLILYWVDHTPTLEFNSGVQRVTRMLARALLEQGARVVPVVWNERLKAPIVASNKDRKALQHWNGPDFGDIENNDEGARQLVPLNFAGPKWLLVPEVTHLTRHNRNLTRPLIRYAHGHAIRTAFLFYDALLARWRMYESQRRRHELYMLQLATADLVLPISRYAAQQLTLWWSARLEHSATAHVEALALPAEYPDVERVTLPAENADQAIHIVSVGPLDRRKNERSLLTAFQRLPESVGGREILLTLVGSGYPTNIKTPRPNLRIQSLGTIPEVRLVSLYKECTFTVFPSLDEGFGLPIAESLWFGKPCICAGFGAMGEFADGGGCLTVDPRNTEQLTTAITRLITEPQLRQKLAQEACARSLPTWSDYAGRVLNRLSQRQ